MKQKELPPFAKKVVNQYNAWIIGSAAKPETIDPRDIDIIVPLYEWHNVAVMIPSDAIPNTFGGWKFTDDGVEIDVFPGDLGYLFLNRQTTHAWQPRLDIRLVKLS